jgi:hypothetical protein
MFLARDKDNHLYLFNKLPVRGTECWWAESGVDGTYLRLDDSLYPEVTWESEPLAVSITNGSATEEA